MEGEQLINMVNKAVSAITTRLQSKFPHNPWALSITQLVAPQICSLMSIQESQVRAPAQPHNFSVDQLWNTFYGLSDPIASSRTAVVIYWRKYVHS